MGGSNRKSDGVLLLFALSYIVLIIGVVTAKDFTLTILHTNDIHARIDEFDAKGSRCNEELRQKDQCYGGIARQKFVVDNIRSRINNTIFLYAGDYYQGTMWFYMLKGNIIAETISFLKHDAMALGNHEFDDGSAGLLPLMMRAAIIKTPVVACNVDFSNDTILRKYQPLPSVVLERSGVQIGVIGFLTPDTRFLSNVDNNTVLTDEIECISREAEKLHKQGVKIIIALGHSGYVKDQEIAEKVPLVSVVVGGHSHSYLSSVEQNTGDPVKGPYPTVVTRKDRTRALVVQDFWLGKYLGYFNVTFDEDTGMVRSWQGNAPLLLNFTVAKDPEVEAFLQEKRAEIDHEANKYAGYSLMELSGDKEDCRFGECALGNLLADAVTKHFIVDSYKSGNNSLIRWNPIDIAVVNGGGIRGSISKGNVTYGDIVTVYPFANAIWVLTLNGSQVKRMYETSVRRYDTTALIERQISYGGFLHSSGARIVVDSTKPAFQRVISIMTLCSTCKNPVWQPLNMSRTYRVAITDYLATGGDDHNFSDVANKDIEKYAIKDTDLLIAYIEQNSPIYAATDERIRIITSHADNCNSAGSQLSTKYAQQLALASTVIAVIWRSTAIILV
ncbi:protein 5NUC-like [Tropilaelaps mercedesae]|uniref:Protein 5NUC-like n=1 Tax=Tropilaelaps mercedesae TaxID=418985 RepID=A0A1V9XQ79_9ACAR|nr:protein 5NUC-like [Tropilaelaps mercedesae]